MRGMLDMRRYGLSIVFVLLIVPCIGTYYIQADISEYPDYTLIKQEGNELEAEDVYLLGHYVPYRTSIPIEVSSSGSDYTNDRPFFRNIYTYYWQNNEVNELIKEHRNFMRGKRSINTLYDDDRLLVYANVVSNDSFTESTRDFYFEVSVLDKQQNKTWSYEAPVPDSELYHFIHVNNVQVYGDEVVILTSNYNINIASHHRYSLGLSSKQTPLDQVIAVPQLEPSRADENISIENAFNTHITKPSRYQVFYSVIRDSSGSKSQISQLFVYDILTGQEVKVRSQQLIDFLQNQQSSYTFAKMNIDGDRLYVSFGSDERVSVAEYHILDGKVTLFDIETDSVKLTEINHQRLYMLTNNHLNEQSLVIVDLSSGETVYRETIGLKDTEQQMSEEINKLYIFQMVVK